MKVALDANCFIDAVTPEARAYKPMLQILEAWRTDAVELLVSLHSIHELEMKPDEALELARECATLPHWPIGTWDEQVGTWEQAEGTWDDSKINEDMREELGKVAKARSSLRDRGAYMDALKAGCEVFLTSDPDLVGSDPAMRLEKRFGLRVTTPGVLARELSLHGC